LRKIERIGEKGIEKENRKREETRIESEREKGEFEKDRKNLGNRESFVPGSVVSVYSWHRCLPFN